MSSEITSRSPLPPFDLANALVKVRKAEDAWNSQNPEAISLAYSKDSLWRNRSEFLQGRVEIVRFLKGKWQRELDYRLIKELWAYSENRIAVKFQYEYRNGEGQWFRAHGNENWEFDSLGLMRRREASINDIAIRDSDRLFHWLPGPRPIGHPGLHDLGL